MAKQLARLLVINYLKLLTYIKLKYKFSGKIIALGGCFGKSSAIGLLESVFSQEHNIYTSNQSGKGLNSETGIPFAILGVKPDRYNVFSWVKYLIQAFTGMFKKVNHEFLILELGVDKPDDLKFLASFIKPNLGIIINSNNTHSANFEKLQYTTKKTFEELIAFENGFIFEASKDGIVYNLDDPEVVKQISRFKDENKIPFSTFNNSSIKRFQLSLNGTEIEFEYKGELLKVNYPEPLLEEYKNTIEMMLKVAEFYDLKPESVVEGLKAYKLPPSRCSLFKGINSSFIIDSSYNSAYLPAASAIKLTNEISKGRKIAILGDMRELGVLSEKEHRKLAHNAADCLDMVITVGPMMKEYFYSEFKGIKKKEQIIHSFETTQEALDLIAKNNFEFVKKDDVILVKSSQNTLLLEIIVEALLENKEDANKLCRRGKHYEEERKKLLV